MIDESNELTFERSILEMSFNILKVRAREHGINLPFHDDALHKMTNDQLELYIATIERLLHIPPKR